MRPSTRMSQLSTSAPSRFCTNIPAKDCLKTQFRATIASACAGSILHLVQTLPGMVAIVVACVAAAIGALLGLALHGSLVEVTAAATIGFVLVIVVMGIWAR